MDVVPLGGLGEVGMNCLALRAVDADGELSVLVLDCGITFPEEDLGLDVIHPDFRGLEDQGEKVRAIVLTHGHEDHIGAVPYLLRRLKLPVYGPAHALALVRRRLDEHKVARSAVDLRTVAPGEQLTIGPFRIEPVRVAHSIAQATALCIDTPAGVIVHSGDFNFDPAPSDGEPTDESRLSEIGDRGVALLMSDSTNIDRRDEGGAESIVKERLSELISAAPGRVVVSLFSSNVQRLISLGQIASAVGRKICLLGRSLSNHLAVATPLGLLDWPSDLMIAPEQLSSYPPSELLVLAGGTQGESAAAMTRLAEGSHSSLKIDSGDTVILSSRIIPGNERLVSRMISSLLRLGVSLHTSRTDPAVHTSGHATRSEQAKMIKLLRPRHFLPLHGTLHHLRAHGALASSLGVSGVRVVENGHGLCLSSDGLTDGLRVPAGRVHIARGGEGIDEAAIGQRRWLGRTGVVSLAAAISVDCLEVRDLSLQCEGLPGISDRDKFEADWERRIEQLILRDGRRWHKNDSDPAHKIRAFLRNRFDHALGVRPALHVHIFEL